MGAASRAAEAAEWGDDGEYAEVMSLAENPLPAPAHALLESPGTP